MKYIKNGKLQDERIVLALQRAAKNYENGEIIEVYDELLAIAAAIEEFIAEEDTK